MEVRGIHGVSFWMTDAELDSLPPVVTEYMLRVEKGGK
jgi:hypothetical protein